MLLHEQSDGELLASSVAEDFGVFYRRHFQAVTSFVAPRVGGADVVFDLVAETFAVALERRKRYEAEARSGRCVADRYRAESGR